METLPKGTTQEQWDRYYADLKAHEERCEREKPNISDYYDIAGICDSDAYHVALSRWRMMCSCDAPNKPGYYRANND